MLCTLTSDALLPLLPVPVLWCRVSQVAEA